MEKMIQKLKEHVIICGYGKMAKYIANELQDAGHPFIIIEQDEDVSKILREKKPFTC